MLAMVANDDAGSLNARVGWTFFASMLAPTGSCVSHSGFIRRRHPGCLVVLVVIAVCCCRKRRARKGSPDELAGAEN